MSAEQPTPRNAYSVIGSHHKRVVSPKGKEPAQQQFKEDCDINSIMRRFQKTGAIDHVSKYQPTYGFASPQTYHDSMNVITYAQSMFNDLPSSVRDEFSNNPQAFLEFVQDPANADRARELGIALSPEAAVKAAELQDAAKNAEEGQQVGDGPPTAGPPPETPSEALPTA